jgi:hypothetical protein
VCVNVFGCVCVWVSVCVSVFGVSVCGFARVRQEME